MANKLSAQRVARSISLSRNKTFRKDLEGFLSAPIDQLTAFAAELLAMRGFATRESARQIAVRCIADHDGAIAVARFTMGIDDIFRRLGESIEGFIDALIASLENENAIDATGKVQLAPRIRLVLVADSPLGRAYKARELATATGRPLDEFKILCDLRPVFDDARIQVFGMVMLTTLKVEWLSPDGMSQGIELILNESQLDSIAEEVAHAQSKRHALQALAEKLELSVPGKNRMPPVEWDLDVAALMGDLRNPPRYLDIIDDDELLRSRGVQVYPPPPLVRTVSLDIIIVTQGRSIRVEAAAPHAVGQWRSVATEHWNWIHSEPFVYKQVFEQSMETPAYPVTTGVHYIPFLYDPEEAPRPPKDIGADIGPPISASDIVAGLRERQALPRLGRIAIGLEQLNRTDDAWQALPALILDTAQRLAEKRPDGYEDILASLLRSYARGVERTESRMLLFFLEKRFPAPVKLAALAGAQVLFSRGPSAHDAVELAVRLDELKRSFSDSELQCVPANAVLFIGVLTALIATGSQAALDQLISEDVPMHLRRLAKVRLAPIAEAWRRNGSSGDLQQRLQTFLAQLP